jgi:hypothetical protein
MFVEMVLSDRDEVAFLVVIEENNASQGRHADRDNAAVKDSHGTVCGLPASALVDQPGADIVRTDTIARADGGRQL